MESNVSYRKVFIEFFFLHSLYFPISGKEFFRYLRVIEGAYYIANYKRKQQQDIEEGEFNKYFSQKKPEKEFFAISLIHIIEFLIVSRHSSNRR